MQDLIERLIVAAAIRTWMSHRLLRLSMAQRVDLGMLLEDEVW